MNMRALALILLAAPAAAEGLEGLTFSFQVRTWDDPARPVYVGARAVATVGGGPEFALTETPDTAGRTTVPVTVDVSARRVELFYKGNAPWRFDDRAFNGYVMRFDAGDCAVFTGARLDERVTTLPMAPGDVIAEGSTLLIDVGGLDYAGSDRIAVDVGVADCAVG